MTIRTRSITVMLAFVGVVGAICGLVSYALNSDAIVVAAARHSLYFSAAELRNKSAQPKARFRLRNSGRQVVKLGRPAVTCGCVVVEKLDELSPGEEAEIVAAVTPPVIGTQTAHITIPTTSRQTPKVELAVDITVEGSVPLFYSVPEVLEFRGIQGDHPSIICYVSTIEHETDDPWIGGVTSDLSFLELSWEKARTELFFVPNTIKNIYKIAATVRESHSGSTMGWIRFTSPDGREIDTGSGDRIQVQTSFEPKFVVRPKRLLAQLSAEAALPTWTIRVVGHLKQPIPKVASVASDREWLHARVVGEHRSEVLVSALHLPSEQVANGTVSIAIDLPTGPETVEVPVTLQR